MEIELAKKIHELDFNELLNLMTILKMKDYETFRFLQELIEDL